MTTRRLLLALTLVNLGLMVFLLTRVAPPAAHGAESVLRARALEIVDDQGRARASIKIQPGGTADGKAYPETVILRLIDPKGHPTVKLAGTEEGGGLGMIAAADAVHVILKAEDASASLIERNLAWRRRSADRAARRPLTSCTRFRVDRCRAYRPRSRDGSRAESRAAARRRLALCRSR